MDFDKLQKEIKDSGGLMGLDVELTVRWEAILNVDAQYDLIRYMMLHPEGYLHRTESQGYNPYPVLIWRDDREAVGGTLIVSKFSTVSEERYWIQVRAYEALERAYRKAESYVKGVRGGKE